MPEELADLCDFINSVALAKAPPEVVFVPEDRWHVLFKQMADWCEEVYGGPYPFVSVSHKEMPNFLCKLVPVVPV